MGIYNNYKEYKKYWPQYLEWQKNKELEQERKCEYLKNNPDKINNDDIQRAKKLLHAVDIMDEYSQANAEDVEVATDFLSSEALMIFTTLGTLGGLSLIKLKSVFKLMEKLALKYKNAGQIISIIPSAIGLVVGFLASLPVLVWATHAKIGSSRRGRFEAMQKDLNNPAIFAVLTPEQIKQIDEQSKNIELDETTKKRYGNKTFNNTTSVFKTLKKMFSEKDKYSEQKKKFDEKIKLSEQNFNKELTPYQILAAKKNKQIIAEIVRKLDVASQDYAENSELATNAITTIALGGGALTGWATNKLTKLMKLSEKSKIAKCMPYIVGGSIPLIFGIYAAQIQKQASRIGRFKAKQELINNPQSLAYVDENDANKNSNIKTPTQKNKPNIFKFFVQLIKENKEYSNYRKTELLEDIKRNKAIEKIQLSQKQLNDAKALQMNIFKTFNKVDEKSQTYSESVETLGKIAEQTLSIATSLIATYFSTRAIVNMMKNPSSKKFHNSFMKIITPLVLSILPVIGLDILITKSQKKASRVADMLALKELDNYRHYANYEDNNNIIASNTKPKETNLLKQLQLQS